MTPSSDRSKLDSRKVVDEANTDKLTTLTTKMKDMVHLLETATDTDRTLVLFEVQQVFEFERKFVLDNIVPAICRGASAWSETVQVPAAETLSVVVTSKIPSELAKSVCLVACDVIRSATDESNRELWGDVLVHVLPHIAWSASELQEAVDGLRGDIENADAERRSARNKLVARVLGSIAMSAVNDDEAKGVIVERAIAMIEDEDSQVRGIIADSMGHIGAALDISKVERELWPSVQRLSLDGNACVHAACMRTISVIAAAHKIKTPTSKLFTQLLPPIFQKECSMLRKAAAADQRKLDEDTYLLVEINSEIFGMLLSSCVEFFQDEVGRKEAFKAFLAMSTSNNPIVRKHCARNFPEVSKCLKERFGSQLVSVLEYFANDVDDETRWTLASRLHETLHHLASKETIAQVFKTVLLLFRDKNWLVRQNVMQNFEPVVAELSPFCTYNSSAKMSSLFEQLQLLCDCNWRVQELLVKQLKRAARLVPPTSMMVNVLPLLYRIAMEGTYLVRKAAMGSIATYIRFLPDAMERDQVMKAFVEEWARGPIYWMRIGFIDAAKIAVGLYSRCLFRDTFGLEVLKLGSDGVSNVRLRVAMILPELAPACHQMEEFHSVAQGLKKDEYRDVREVAEGVDEKIEQSLARGRASFEEDMKLEEEERDLYSRHLQNQKEANKKKSGLMKATTAWWSNKTKVSIASPTKTDEGEGGRKSALNITKSSSIVSATDEQTSSVSADWEKCVVERWYSSDFSSSKDDNDVPASPRNFKGRRVPKPSRSGGTTPRRTPSARQKK